MKCQCPNCGHTWQITTNHIPTARSGSGGTTASPEPSERHAVPNRDICFLLEKSEKCKPEWKEFLSKLRGYTGDISKKQYNFFAVIHKECMGAWPGPEACQAVSAPVDIAREVITDDVLLDTF